MCKMCINTYIYYNYIVFISFPILFISGEVLDGAATGAPVDKKPNQSLVRKNNSLPMEVT